MISFKTESIFGKGFKSGTRLSSCALSHLLAEGVLQLDGTLDASALDRVDKKEVWQYIYYLWYHNHETVSTFKAMSNPTVPNRASALHFVEAVARVLDKGGVTDTLSFSLQDLAVFVHRIQEQVGAAQLKNPFLETIQRSVLQKLQRTGMPAHDGKATVPVPVLPQGNADGLAVLDTPTYRLETRSVPYTTNTGDPGVRLSIHYKPVPPASPETI